MSEENKNGNDLNIESLPPVGKRLYIPCKKCERERYHLILAHKTPTSAKIECEVCKGKKTFSLKKSKTGKARVTVARRGKPKKSAEEVARENWLELKEKTSQGGAQPYNMKEKFTEKDVIEHKKFGLGFVTETTGHKIIVAFEDAQRELVHNR